MTEPTTTPRPHAEFIKAWADGAEIEFAGNGGWELIHAPSWSPEMKYRIKPTPPKPIVVIETFHSCSSGTGVLFGGGPVGNSRQVAFTIDPTTRDILSVELVKE